MERVHPCWRGLQLRALALAGGDEDGQRRYSGLLHLARAGGRDRGGRHFARRSGSCRRRSAPVISPEVEAREPLRAPLFAVAGLPSVSKLHRDAADGQTAALDARAMRAPAPRRRSGALRTAGSSRAAMVGAQALV